MIIIVTVFSSFTCLKENEWSVAAHHSSGFSPWSWWCVLLLFSTKTCEVAKPTRLVLGKWWCRGSQTQCSLLKSVTLTVTLGRSPAMNHLIIMSKPCFADSWWGRFRAKQEITQLKQCLMIRGLVLGFSPASLTQDVDIFYVTSTFSRELLVGVKAGEGWRAAISPSPAAALLAAVCSPAHAMWSAAQRIALRMAAQGQLARSERSHPKALSEPGKTISMGFSVQQNRRVTGCNFSPAPASVGSSWAWPGERLCSPFLPTGWGERRAYLGLPRQENHVSAAGGICKALGLLWELG